MKKLLLIATMAATAAAASAQTDVTPKNYHFNSAEALPVFSNFFHGANIEAGGWTTQNMADEWNNGLIVISGNAINEGGANHASGKAVAEAIQLVDLGGTVGKVFCFAGYGSNVNEGLKEITGVDYGIKECTAGHPWFNLNFYLDPKNTPKKSSGIMHVKITYNVYSPEFTRAVSLGSVYAVTDQNGVRPEQADGNGSTPFDHQKNFTEDPMTEDMAYDPTKWIEYEWDVDCPEDDADSDLCFAPLRLKANFGGNWGGTGQCIFIKDITVTHLPDVAEARQGAGERSYTEVSYEMGTPATTGVANVANAANDLKVSVNGNTVSLSEAADIYTIAGVKVATACESTVLANGFYVAVAGRNAVKFAVK